MPSAVKQNIKLSLGFSPCPNDCFIFDALLHEKIDTEGLHFEAYMGDVEDLNSRAFRAALDISKLSYHAYAFLAETYVLLDAGSALGNNCGPLLISRSGTEDLDRIPELRIAIPGKFTSANLLFSLAFPDAGHKTELLFSEIENAVARGEVEAGLIIHESRFTYAAKGLKKIIDLGEYWQELVHAPIPLGGIAIKRSLPHELKQKVNRVLKRSVEFAFANRYSSLNFVKANAQEMNEEVIYQHIDLYVNRFSVDLGYEGKRAITLLYERASEKGIVPRVTSGIFIT